MFDWFDGEKSKKPIKPLNNYQKYNFYLALAGFLMAVIVFVRKIK